VAARAYISPTELVAEALDRVSSSSTVIGWFPAGFAQIYPKHKKGEMAFIEGESQEGIWSLYEQVY
jgi:glutamine synthetase